MHVVHTSKRLLPTKTSKKVHKIIFDNRKVKLIEIAETLKISKECVGHIVNEYLDIRKLCSKWVPRELTIDPKQQRIDDSKNCLELFKRNKFEFLRRYVTMDETWLHHFTPESNRSQPSGLHAMNQLQSVERRKSRLVRPQEDALWTKFCADEEIIAETEAYFTAEDKSYYKNGIEKLYGRYNRCIALEGNYIE
ncbi:putative DD34D transposase [Trichonephila clavipes]|nr:putative DD34D transposase [Trichonephila clavipes]